MADITSIMGGAWSPPSPPQPDPPELQLRDAMKAAGLTPPDVIQLDGKLHRFRSGTKGTPGKGDKPGWYICFGDGIPAGRFGCWRAGIEVTWRADVGRLLSDAEQIIHARRLGEAIKLRDDAIKREREAVANTADKIFVQGMLADEEHPYLKRKGVRSHGIRVTGDGRLIVPLYNPEGRITSLQYIDADGGKLYHSGGQTGGCFWMIGTMDEPGVLYIAEGFATAATIHEVTNRPCVVAYSASNIVPVTGTMREKYGATQELVIVADNDASGTGQKFADQASAKYGARVVIPPIDGDANDYVQAGYDLKILLNPQSSDWLVPADDFCTKPAPIKWLVKHWLQEQALIMVHGPSGGGKTFAVLDWSMHMAAGLPDWNGHKVKAGTVVYLAGEGHHGLRSRVAAWKQHHRARSLNMWLSKAGCDLNTPEGYQRVLDAVRSLPNQPSLIVIDTLHRFLLGDENSAQDAKTMIDACAGLMREFECSVLLVHHTGVSDEAQHRARGSSAWKGALEIEISIVPAKGETPMQIVQRKSKDAEEAEPIYASLNVVPIKGWMDEDGEQVSSAVLTVEEAPTAPKKESKLDGHRKTWERAWWAGGAETREGSPYVSRSALKDMLMADGNAERTVRNMVNPSYSDKLIGALIQGEIIEAFEHGWIMLDEVNSSAMLLRKNGDPK